MQKHRHNYETKIYIGQDIGKKILAIHRMKSIIKLIDTTTHTRTDTQSVKSVANIRTVKVIDTKNRYFFVITDSIIQSIYVQKAANLMKNKYIIKRITGAD